MLLTENAKSSKFEKIKDLLPILHKRMNGKRYVIQEYIPLEQHQSRSYDFRVLAHFVSGEWFLTGIGVRWAGENQLTTHVLKGGKVLSLESLQKPVDNKVIQQLAVRTGNQLRKAYGNVREISIDVGKTKNQDYYIFEVNAKPMVFDEAAIENKRHTALIQIFFEESGFAYEKTLK